MTALTYTDVVASGGGRVVYLLYVAGMPWAVSTETISGLTTTQRRVIFGGANTTYGVGHYPADDVPIYPWLDRSSRSPQSIKLKDTQAMIDIGTWSCSILDRDPGVSWDHVNGSRTVYGLDGLSTSPDPRVDNGIYWGRLGATYERADTTALPVTGDVGGQLHAAVAARHAAATPTYLWIGGECVATTGAPSALSTEGGWTVNVVRGVYRTKDQTHVVSPTEIAPVRIADAPLGGLAAGRGAYLWAVVIDDDGAPIADPALVRHGRVSSQVTWSSAAYRVTVEPWTAWLDCTVRPEPIKAHMRGYHLCRGGDGEAAGVLTPDTGAGQFDTVPHLVMWEWHNGTAKYVRRDIWLCDFLESVFYETYQELEDALRAELARASAGTSTLSDALDWDYDVGPCGLWHLSESAAYDNALSFVSGPLPWLLGWNPPNAQRSGSWADYATNGSFYVRADQLEAPPGEVLSGTRVVCVASADHLRRVYPTKELDWTSYNFEGGGYTPDETMVGPNNRSEYLVGYGWDDVANNLYYDTPSSGTPWVYCGMPTTEYIFPGQPDNSVGLVFLDFDSDATALSNVVSIGLYTVRFSASGVMRATRMHGVVSSTDADKNMIALTVDGPLQWVGQNASYVSALTYTYDHQPGAVYLGQYLHYVRAWHSQDPWLVQQTISYTASKFSHLFRSLLGEAITGIQIPKTLQFDHVPDAITVGDFTATINWASFDLHARKVVPQQVWRVSFDDDLNLYELFTSACATAGICPTYEFNATTTPPQHILRARPIGVVDATEAYYSGRWLDESVVQRNTPIELEASSGDLLQSVSAELHWDTRDDKYKVKIAATSEASKENTGSRSGEMKIRDKLTFFPYVDLTSATFRNDLIAHFASTILANCDSPMPSARAKATAVAALLCAPGTVGLVTDASVKNPYTGGYGLSAWPCLYTGQSIDLRDGSVTVDLRLSPKGALGWAPTFVIPADSSSVAGDEVITVTATTDHQWTTDSAFARKDLSYFGNITRCLSLGSGYTTRNTTPYYVTIYELSDSYDVHQKGQAVWRGNYSITNIDVSAGTCTITDEDGAAAFAAYDETKVHVVTYADFDNANLADEQRLWCYLGDIVKALSDGTDTYTGSVWC